MRRLLGAHRRHCSSRILKLDLIRSHCVLNLNFLNLEDRHSTKRLYRTAWSRTMASVCVDFYRSDAAQQLAYHSLECRSLVSTLLQVFSGKKRGRFSGADPTSRASFQRSLPKSGCCQQNWHFFSQFTSRHFSPTDDRKASRFL